MTEPVGEAPAAGAGAGLGALLTRQTVRARLHASTSAQATEAVGRLLVEEDAVEPRYVEAMKSVLRDMGPYAVIAPGIVLLHARPDDGVHRPCLALATLAVPVSFGHSTNDPVDVVVAFGAIDKASHLESLQGLARLLADEATLRRIRNAATNEALLAAIEEDPAPENPKAGHETEGED